MLNELKEYEQYTFSLPKISLKDAMNNFDKALSTYDKCSETFEKSMRLKYSTLIDKGAKNYNVSAFVRALTIIARKEYYSESASADIVKSRLKDWFNNWLNPYLCLLLARNYKEKVYNPESVQTLLKELGEDISSKIANYAKPIFKYDIVDDTKGNNFRKECYDSILSSAYYSGPLKKYYLVCDSDEIVDFEFSTNKATKLVSKDLALKVTASYLLSKNNKKDCEILSKEYLNSNYVFINKSDIANWTPKRDKIDKFNLFASNKDCLYIFDGAPIFTEVAVSGDKKSNKAASKLCISENWISHFDLVEERDFDSWRRNNPNDSFYSDFGSNEPLRLNVEY